MLPRFRIVAVSMQRLQIGVARIAAIPIDVIHLNPVVMLEEQPAQATAPVLRLEQLGQSRTGVRVPSLSCTPVHPIPIIRAAVTSHFNVSRDRYRTMRQQVHGVRIGGGGGKGQPVVHSMPVPLLHPAGGFPWMSSACPAAELFPGEEIEPPEGGLTHAGAVIIGPSAYFRIELMDQGTLGEGFTAPDDPSKLGKMRRHVGLGGLIRVLNPGRWPLERLPDWCLPTRY